MEKHLCLREEKPKIEIHYNPNNRKECPLCVKCCLCKTIIFKEMDNETLKNFCERFNFEVVKGEELIKS